MVVVLRGHTTLLRGGGRRRGVVVRVTVILVLLVIIVVVLMVVTTQEALDASVMLKGNRFSLDHLGSVMCKVLLSNLIN